MTLFHSRPLAILGGGGKAGRPLVHAALRAGYRVRLLLRQPEAFDLRHERLELLPGDARQPDSLRNLLTGCGALLSTLGHPKGEPTPLLGTITELILAALREAGIRRYLVVTSLYDTGTEALDDATRTAAAYMRQHFGPFMADRDREFQLLSESDLDWTYVRIPYLVPEPGRGNVAVSLAHLPGDRIAGEDLARFLLDELQNPVYRRQAPFVASRLAPG